MTSKELQCNQEYRSFFTQQNVHGTTQTSKKLQAPEKIIQEFLEATLKNERR